MRRILALILVLLLLSIGALAVIFRGGRHEGPGQITQTVLPPAVVKARSQSQTTALAKLSTAAAGGGVEAVAGPAAKQILFGDLHVHTTYSADAFLRTLPLMQGEGAHPPADACDFARYCSGVDFWSINDHAEAVTPQHWRETKEAIRQCNAVAGDPKNPDVVAFLGWEWTQVGQTPEDHYGHKNVIFRETAEERVPKRPIGSVGQLVQALRQQLPFWLRIQPVLFDLPNRQRYLDFGEFMREVNTSAVCASGVDTRQLPEDCMETAADPRELFDKLAQWGFDSIVIPHGTTWGFYTPARTKLDKQLTAAQHDPDKQILFEIYSGHGNSEEYRSWKAIDHEPSGELACPAPGKNYEPCCWRAGEIIRQRCGNAPADECERRVREARANYLKAGLAGHLTVPGAKTEEWKDCAQCRDCFNPSFNYRPGNSAQYALALSNFDDPKSRRRFNFGFIASSDNHSARPGTGYKEYQRRIMTEAIGAKDQPSRERLLGSESAPADESRPFDRESSRLLAFQLTELERQASFFMTGGIVAVHSPGRDRDSIWGSFKKREVYGTSGERILLWFDLLNAAAGPQPMGSTVAMRQPPRFRVRAAGSFKQKPGCPEHSVSSLPAERIEYLCRGECYNPTDERHRITRIEVVRVRPQQRQGEPVEGLIEDVWRRFDCPADSAGCVVEFDDPDFAVSARDSTYYVRAIQAPTQAVNAGGVRCTYDAAGNCIDAKPCYGDYRTGFDDDCLAPNEERAWSSPIYVAVGGAS